MDEWEVIFAGAQSIAASAETIEDGLKQATAFAKQFPQIFDEPDYWKQLTQEDIQPLFDRVVGWAREGLENLGAGDGWDFAILDLGDCPEIFRLYRLAFQPFLVEEKFGELITSQRYLEYGQFEDCLSPDVENPNALLFTDADTTLTDHNVGELGSTVLNWNTDDNTEMDFHDNSGYLAWLIMGSLTLREPLRNTPYCRRIMQGRERLYLLAGFESIFFHLATVTSDGLVFGAQVTKAPPLTLPELPAPSVQQAALEF